MSKDQSFRGRTTMGHGHRYSEKCPKKKKKVDRQNLWNLPLSSVQDYTSPFTQFHEDSTRVFTRKDDVNKFLT